MPYDREFPALARVTNGMESTLLLEVSKNLTAYSVEVRIEYEQWVQFRKEYDKWSRQQYQSAYSDGASEKEKDDFDKTAHS